MNLTVSSSQPINQNTKWVGLICNTNTNKPVEIDKGTPYWLIRIIAMEKELHRYNYKVFAYSPYDVDLNTLSAHGYYLMDDKLIPTELPIPFANYDYYFGRSPRETDTNKPTLTQFVRIAAQHSIQIYNPRAVNRFAKDKYNSYTSLKTINKRILPYTEILKDASRQLSQFLNNYDILFIKPQYGSQGNNIIVIKKKSNNFHCAFYKNMNVYKKVISNLNELEDYVFSRTKNREYIIQQGIDGLLINGSAFDIRVVVINDNQKWRSLHLIRLGASGSDISNLSQGGSVWETHTVLNQIFSDDKTEDIINNLNTIAIELTQYIAAQYQDQLIEISLDFILDKEGNPYLAEINTKPGLVGIQEYYEVGFLSMTEMEQHLFEHYSLPHGQLLARFLMSKDKNNESDLKTIMESIWFNDMQNNICLSQEEQHCLAQYILYSLNKKATSYPSTIIYQKPCILFVSVVSKRNKAKIIIGSGRDLQQAIDRTISKYLDKYPHRKAKAIKLDIVKKVTYQPQVNLSKEIPIIKSLQGFAFDKSSNIAFIPEQVQVNRLINNKNLLQPKYIAKVLQSFPHEYNAFTSIQQHNNADIWTFETTSIYFDECQSFEIYRGHRVFKEINSALLLDAAKQAGNYLIRILDNQGHFNYSYRPLQNKSSDKYNILRHAGCIYAILELYEETKDEKLLTAAQRASDYLLKCIKPDKELQSKTRCVVEKGFIKLGGNALAILAFNKLIKLTNNKKFIPIVEELGLWITKAQGKEGNFVTFKQNYETKKVTDFESEYYPGEAIYALASLYSIKPSSIWLDVAENAARYLINKSKNTAINNLIHDHWLLYGLTALYKLVPDPLYVTASARISQAIMNAQNEDCHYIDWNGGFNNPPRTTPTSIRVEGLLAAYELARIVDNQKLMAEIKDCVTAACKFLLHTQYQPESTIYFKNPDYVLGAFRQSLIVFETRIDYSQHAISALLGTYRIL